MPYLAHYDYVLSTLASPSLWNPIRFPVRFPSAKLCSVSPYPNPHPPSPSAMLIPVWLSHCLASILFMLSYRIPRPVAARPVSTLSFLMLTAVAIFFWSAFWLRWPLFYDRLDDNGWLRWPYFLFSKKDFFSDCGARFFPKEKTPPFFLRLRFILSHILRSLYEKRKIVFAPSLYAGPASASIKASLLQVAPHLAGRQKLITSTKEASHDHRPWGAFWVSYRLIAALLQSVDLYI